MIDSGSDTTKCGTVGGSDVPPFIFRESMPERVSPSLLIAHLATVWGKPRHQGSMIGKGLKDFYIGHEAAEKRGILSLRPYVEHGQFIEDRGWRNGESSMFDGHWHYILEQLRTEKPPSRVLLADTIKDNEKVRERTAQYLFEQARLEAVAFADRAALSLYAMGLQTGSVVDSGHGLTRSCAVKDGRVLPETDMRNEVAGHDAFINFAQIVGERGYHISKPKEIHALRQIKDKASYVALDYDEAVQNPPKDQSFSWGEDGLTMELGNELFRAPEALFHPSLVDKETYGVHEMVYNSIIKTDIDDRGDFYSHIALVSRPSQSLNISDDIIQAGGSTMAPGFRERMQKELVAYAPSRYNVQVHASPDRANLALIGAAKMASNDALVKQIWITKQDWAEHGASILNEREFERSIQERS